MWKRLLRGGLAVLSGQAILALANLALVPLYLRYWSVAVYGEWLALFSVVAYFTTFDLGMNMAVTNRLTQAYAKGDSDEYAQAQHSALVFYVTAGFAATLVLLLVAWVLPVPKWLGLRTMPRDEAAWILLLLGLQVAWSILTRFLVNVYRTTGHLAPTQWILNGQRLLLNALTAVVLILGGAPRTVALIQLTPMLVAAGFVLWDVRRRFPELTPGFRQARLAVIKSFVVPSVLFLFIQLANGLAMHGPVLVLSTALGGAAVAVFATSRTLMNLMRQMVGALNTALWPDLTRLEAQQRYEGLRRAHRLLIVVSTTGIIVAASVLWFAGDEIMIAWTGGRLEPDLVLLRFLAIQLVLSAPWLASSVFTASANRHKNLSFSYLAAAVIAVGLSAVLVGRLGTWSVPVGVLIGEALACYHFVIRDTCRLIGEDYPGFAVRMWLGLAVVGGGTFLAEGIVYSQLPMGSPGGWAGLALTGLLVALALAWFVWLRSDERGWARQQGRTLLAWLQH